MYSFEISERFLSNDEKLVFANYLSHSGLNDNIWKIFECLFKSSIPGNVPHVLKVYEEEQLCGAAFIVNCSKYGRALFANTTLARIANAVGLPFYLWIKFGCCMDMMSNPGFVRDPAKSDEICTEMASFLGKESILTIIYDFDTNSNLYPTASVLPSLPHALIDTSEMKDISDYLKYHKNIKKKMRVFENKGGSFEITQRKLASGDLHPMQKCFISTAEKSIFYLPYQDLYLNSATNTSTTDLDSVLYFIARFNGEFLGYQAAIKTGRFLNALHGAFDRSRSTTYHAYDILFVKMTEFALENGLEIVDFGSVLNITKQRMVNRTKNMSYYIFSKYRFVQWIMTKLLFFTEVQGEEQLKFRTNPT